MNWPPVGLGSVILIAFFAAYVYAGMTLDLKVEVGSEIDIVGVVPDVVNSSLHVSHASATLRASTAFTSAIICPVVLVRPASE